MAAVDAWLCDAVETVRAFEIKVWRASVQRNVGFASEIFVTPVWLETDNPSFFASPLSFSFRSALPRQENAFLHTAFSFDILAVYSDAQDLAIGMFQAFPFLNVWPISTLRLNTWKHVLNKRMHFIERTCFHVCPILPGVEHKEP